MAREAGKRIVVLGQTVGPDLEPRHRELLHSQLLNADFVWVREQDSAALLDHWDRVRSICASNSMMPGFFRVSLGRPKRTSLST